MSSDCLSHQVRAVEPLDDYGCHLSFDEPLMSSERSNQHIVTNADGIQPLVRLLSAKSGQMREQVRGLHEGA